MKNEIVTYGKGYILNQGISTIIKSANKINAKITVISDLLDSSVINFVKENNGNIFPTSNFSKFNVESSLSPYTLKVIYFYLYIKNFSNAENVYLCDLTDVYFQKNIFDIIKNNKVYVSSENKQIKDCDVNTAWMNICYNAETFEKYKDLDIINGGSILGKRESCINLLKEMCTDMQGIISRVGNYANIDQASLTKTVHSLKKYNILDNYEIANLAQCTEEDIKEDKLFKVKDRYPYVIHQYDIHTKLKEKIYKK